MKDFATTSAIARNKLNLIREEAIDNRDITLNKLLYALKNQGITNLSSLVKFLKQGANFEDLELQQTYIKFLKQEVISKSNNIPQHNSSSGLGKYLAEKYSCEPQESFRLITFNNDNRVVSETKIAIGSDDRACVDIKAVFRQIIADNASGFVVCHNHPSGKLIPSELDFKLTECIHKLADIMQVDFFDHFIIGNCQYLSMAENEIF